MKAEKADRLLFLRQLRFDRLVMAQNLGHPQVAETQCRDHRPQLGIKGHHPFNRNPVIMRHLVQRGQIGVLIKAITAGLLAEVIAVHFFLTIDKLTKINIAEMTATDDNRR